MKIASVEVYAIDLPRIATSVMQQKHQGMARKAAKASHWKLWTVADRAGRLQLATCM